MTTLARMKIDGIVYLIDPVTCKAYTCDDAPTEVGVLSHESGERMRLHTRPDIEDVMRTKRDTLRLASQTATHATASSQGSGSLETAADGAQASST